MTHPYAADRSIYGRLRRRLARVIHQAPARLEGLKKSLITFSFDDAPGSAADAGALLEARGVRGTYFISAGLSGPKEQEPDHLGGYASLDAIRRLAAAGHEIACHTYTHLDCGKASGAAIARDIDLNAAAFRGMGLAPATTFAYPYGDVSVAAKAVLDARFIASRALHHGLITTGCDLNQAPAVGIEGANGEATAVEWMERAQAQPQSWLVLYTHDVRDTPSDGGCTPVAFARLVDRALAMGFDVVTFAEGAARAGQNTIAPERFLQAAS